MEIGLSIVAKERLKLDVSEPNFIRTLTSLTRLTDLNEFGNDGC